MEINGMVNNTSIEITCLIKLIYFLPLDVYFVPTIAYLLFSVGDYLGRIVAGRFQKVII